MFDISDTIVPKSDQINADDLMPGPRTVTITGARGGNAEQPVEIMLAEYGDRRPFRPGKSMRRVMVELWGCDAHSYTGKPMTLYRDPSVTFGPDVVGGIRISHMSHIDGEKRVSLTAKRGRRVSYVVRPLVEDAPLPDQSGVQDRAEKAVAAFAGIGVDLAGVESRIDKPRAEWDAHDIASLGVLFNEARAAYAVEGPYQ